MWSDCVVVCRMATLPIGTIGVHLMKCDGDDVEVVDTDTEPEDVSVTVVAEEEMDGSYGGYGSYGM